MNIIVTGGAGFIGSALIRFLIGHTEHNVINIDRLTYAGNLLSLTPVANNERYRFYQADIGDKAAITKIFNEHQPTAIMHLAAESHVDRSIDGPAPFMQTNIMGTFNLLEVSREYYQSLSTEQQSSFRFHHVSTDEVYGSLTADDEPFHEHTPYTPNSPYSASKAASDHLVRAWFHTYGMPTIISNCSNNYGPYHFPEKMIPLMILNALDEKPLPVYGNGEHIRDWLFVEDHARALYLVMSKGVPGEVYNIGGNNEKTNLEVVSSICNLLDKVRPRESQAPYKDLINFVTDRPGHDQRYAINNNKITTELGWKPAETFESGLQKTLTWYLYNPQWCQQVQDGSYQRERLGLTQEDTL